MLSAPSVDQSDQGVKNDRHDEPEPWRLKSASLRTSSIFVLQSSFIASAATRVSAAKLEAELASPQSLGKSFADLLKTSQKNSTVA